MTDMIELAFQFYAVVVLTQPTTMTNSLIWNQILRSKYSEVGKGEDLSNKSMKLNIFQLINAQYDVFLQT